MSHLQEVIHHSDPATQVRRKEPRVELKMGIASLLPALKSAIAPCHIRELSGLKAGVDVSGWIHRRLGKDVKQFILRQVHLLRQHNIEPVLIFDGPEPEAKRATLEARAIAKRRNLERAQEKLEAGDEEGANKLLIRTGVRTEEMQDDIKNWCKLNGVWFVQSPFESDAQLAFMMHTGRIDFVISEDADMILYGCDKVLLKWNWGQGELFDKSRMTTLWEAPFDMDCFRAVCIGIGCDYYKGGIRYLGIEKAKRIFKELSPNYNFNRFVTLVNKLPRISTGKDFPDAFMRAVSTFKFQLVFDPATQSIVPLSPYPKGTSHRNYPYAGCMEIAKGEEYKPPFLPLTLEVDMLLTPVFFCVDCTESFPSKSLLRSHRKSEHPLRCSTCQKPFICRAYLEDHMRIHEGPPTLACNRCNQVFHTSRQLSLHQHSHKEKTIPCTFPGCHEVFRRMGHMKEHALTHTKRERVRCSKCGKYYASQPSLKNHIRTGSCKGIAPPNNTKITDFFRPLPEQ